MVALPRFVSARVGLPHNAARQPGPVQPVGEPDSAIRQAAAGVGQSCRAGEGARAIVAMATVEPDGPTGGFFDDQGPVPW